ncbi:MAG TPA: hypothetical protein VHU22_17590, partial [Xanthobacteraceae bacterium]|nr:hypothetical protein [Xanthobacteraceae bacterium]
MNTELKRGYEMGTNGIDDDDARRIGDALRMALRRKPIGREAVLAVIGVMLDIEHREAMQKQADLAATGPRPAKPSWTGQAVHTVDEHLEASKQRVVDFWEGSEAHRRRILGLPLITEAESALARSIETVFTALLPEQYRIKDWT